MPIKDRTRAARAHVVCATNGALSIYTTSTTHRSISNACAEPLDLNRNTANGVECIVRCTIYGRAMFYSLFHIWLKSQWLFRYALCVRVRAGDVPMEQTANKPTDQ